MKIEALGHVVLKVGDRARSEAFYRDVLGLPLVARYEELEMTFFSLGNHHDFAIQALGANARPPGGEAVGLQHVAFRIGGDMEALRRARSELKAAGVEVRAVDHVVSRSLYFRDPDGNGLEVYVDVSDEWRRNPAAVAQSRPLEI